MSVQARLSTVVVPSFARTTGERVAALPLSTPNKAPAKATPPCARPPSQTTKKPSQCTQPSLPSRQNRRTRPPVNTTANACGISPSTTSSTFAALRRQHTARGTHFSDTPTPAEHLLLLHGLLPTDRTSARYVGLRRLSEGELVDIGLPHQLKVSKNPLSALMDAANQLIGEPNVFVTQASFKWGDLNDKDRHRCTLHYTESIGVIFVDLDVYNTAIYNEYGGDPQKITEAILAQCDKAGIAKPVLIHSGQGFYAYWVLAERYQLHGDASRIARWQHLQARLIELLRDFGADSKVKDTTRVLRLVGTVNGKNGRPVSVTHDDGAVHTFNDLEAQTQAVAVTPNTPPKACSKTAPAPRMTRKEKAAKTNAICAPVVSLPVVIPDHVPQAIARLVALRDQESLLVNTMSPFQLRYWRAFSDIVELIRIRNGLRHGQRDEVLFWLFVTRYHAGLVSSEGLAEFSALCAPVCDTPLDLYASGMLASLLARTQSKRPCKATTTSTEAVRHTVRHSGSLFSKTAYRAPKRLGSANAKGMFARSMVYTPTYETLRKKLAITATEQAQLVALISEKERTHRAYLASPTAARLARHAQAIEIAQRDGIESVMRELSMSRATAYRVTQSVRKTPSVSLNKSRVYRLRAQGFSLRTIAREVGVSLSTVSRWLTHYAKQKQTQAFERELSRIALASNSTSFPSLAFSSTSVLSSPFLRSLSCVPLSHFTPLTMEGERQKGHEKQLMFKRYMYLYACACVCAREEGIEERETPLCQCHKQGSNESVIGTCNTIGYQADRIESLDTSLDANNSGFNKPTEVVSGLEVEPDLALTTALAEKQSAAPEQKSSHRLTQDQTISICAGSDPTTSTAKASGSSSSSLGAIESMASLWDSAFSSFSSSKRIH